MTRYMDKTRTWISLKPGPISKKKRKVALFDRYFVAGKKDFLTKSDRKTQAEYANKLYEDFKIVDHSKK